MKDKLKNFIADQAADRPIIYSGALMFVGFIIGAALL